MPLLHSCELPMTPTSISSHDPLKDIQVSELPQFVVRASLAFDDLLVVEEDGDLSTGGVVNRCNIVPCVCSRLSAAGNRGAGGEGRRGERGRQ